MTSDGIRYSNIDPDQEISAAPWRDRRDGTAEVEPVAGRNVALGDRHEAREPRLGGEEIVAARVERALGTEIADREQLAVVVEQKAEIHCRAPSPARSPPGPRGAPPKRRLPPPTHRDHGGGSRSRFGSPPPRTACPRRCRRLVRSRAHARCRPWSRPEPRASTSRSAMPSPSTSARRRSAASTASASSSWRHVTVCVRRPSRSRPASSRMSSSASAIPARRRSSASG